MFEKIKNNKLLLFISLLIVIFVVLLLSRLTYAYLKSETGQRGVTEGNITASGDRLIFNKGADLALNLNTDTFNSSSGNVEAVTRPSATLIANKSTEEAIAHYLVGIDITENSFVYSSTEKTAELILTVKDETGTIIEEAIGLDPVTVNGVKGFDITEKQGSFNIVTNKEITSKNSDEGETQEWEIMLTLINLEGDQSVNETASINVNIIMNEFEEINSIEDLVRLSNRVNAGHNFEGAYIVLTKDLDFTKEEDYEESTRTDFGDINGNSNNEPLITELTSGTGFNPIGSSEAKSFQGIFEGNNHTIKNLYIEKEGRGIGLFGVIKNAQISNLKITGEINKVIDGAGLAGYTYGDVTIDNVHNEVTIKNTNNSSTLGGLIGINYGGLKIVYSSNNASIGDGYRVGGLIGLDKGSTKIKHSYNGESGTITGSYCGGIIGHQYGEKTQIEDTYNLGNIGILEKDSWVGGIIGALNNASNNQLINVYNKGIISGNYRVAGLIGLAVSNIVINKCYNMGNINGGANGIFDAGGLIGLTYTTINVFILNSYNVGNIKTIDLNDEATSISASGGLIGSSTALEKITILNSYNKGNIEDFYQANGISPINGEISYLNNIYNIGTVEASRKYEIGLMPSTNVVSNNIYYDKNGNGIGYGIAMEKEEMLTNKFVDILNSNVISETSLKNGDNEEIVTLEEIDSILKDYTLSKWVLGDDGYPSLVNE